jgi:hypothetical protein
VRTPPARAPTCAAALLEAQWEKSIGGGGEWRGLGPARVPPWSALSLAVRGASGHRQVDAQVACHAACKWEELRPMTTGSSEHMAHSSLTKKQKRLVQKKHCSTQ